MIEFAIFWFGLGAFVAIVNFIQWCFDGCLIGEGPEDPYYYLFGMMQNALSGFFLGPIILLIQIVTGMPILPHRRG